ncbi:MAG: hypothetical protein Q9219_002926 [cf. Caloplaca sp. 3 TL-2023]
MQQAPVAASQPTATQLSTSSMQDGKRSTKKRLTDEERRVNHIISETNRRATLRDAFVDMIQHLPDVEEDAHCRPGYVLKKFMEHAQKQLDKRKELIRQLEAKGVDVEKELQVSKAERGPNLLPPPTRKNAATGPKRKRKLSEITDAPSQDN